MKSEKDFNDFIEYIAFSSIVGRNILLIRESRTDNNINNDVILLFYCTPIQLSDHKGPRPVKSCRKLKKWKLLDVVIDGNEFKKCFRSRPELQCEYDGSYNPNVMALLANVPKLMSLRLEHIHSSDDLELNAQVFNSIASFENLDVSSLIADSSVLKNAVLPLKLKKNQNPPSCSVVLWNDYVDRWKTSISGRNRFRSESEFFCV